MNGTIEKQKIDAICTELSEKLQPLIGFYLGADHVHHIQADGSGWYYYIENLKPGYPVLAMHYRGPLMLAVPYQDWQQLVNDEITVDEYIAGSYWNYGYFWGGGGLISGAYWQPLEDGPGIHDTERISRYLRILSCRTFRRSSGYMPSVDNCIKCPLDETACPFSTLNQTGDWANEIAEKDLRLGLVDAIRDRVEAEYDLKLRGIMSHNRGRDELILLPGYESGTVEVYIHRDLLNDLLCHPHIKRDFPAMVDEMNMHYDESCAAVHHEADESAAIASILSQPLPTRVTFFQRVRRLFAHR